MKIKTSSYVIFLIFALTLALRLYLVLSAPNLSDENAYFHLRHINNIIEDKKIIYYDFLSYGGRYVLQPPLFHIIMALLSFGNIFLLKILPELFFSLLVVLVYLIVMFLIIFTSLFIISRLDWGKSLTDFIKL